MITREAQHPGADAHNLVQRGTGGPDLYEDILHNVFCDDIRLGKMIRKGIDEIPVLVKQLPEGGFVALSNAQQQLVILVMGAQCSDPWVRRSDKNREKKLSLIIPAANAQGCS